MRPTLRAEREPSVRVIVTRPAPQAADWVERLRARQVDAVALPLIAIAPPADAGAVDAAWRDLATRQLVVFVSPNAAERFFAARPAQAAWPDGVLAASTGPGTTRALQRLGVAAEAIVEPAADAAQFDSEALWDRLAARDWHGARVLIVRGDGGRDWLADTLRRHGARVERVSAYRRVVPDLDAAAIEQLRGAVERPAHHLWLFSSSEAVDTFAALASAASAVPGAADWTTAAVLATHPRIAARARARGFARVVEAGPGIDAVVACIQSFRP